VVGTFIADMSALSTTGARATRMLAEGSGARAPRPSALVLPESGVVDAPLS